MRLDRRLPHANRQTGAVEGQPRPARDQALDVTDPGRFDALQRGKRKYTTHSQTGGYAEAPLTTGERIALETARNLSVRIRNLATLAPGPREVMLFDTIAGAVKAALAAPREVVDERTR